MKSNLGTMDKTLLLETKKKSFAPFADKIPFIASIILGSVDKEAIKKIILFGSYAYGKPTKHSDIDICVIVPNRRKSRSIYVKLAMALFKNKIMPVDLLVYKEKDFIVGIKENERGIESVINAEGRVLYGQNRVCNRNT
jgi:predicted nucleotidyltransferase